MKRRRDRAARAQRRRSTDPGSYFAAARRRASADFLRAAVLRWTTPLLTALSSVRMASRIAAGRPAPSAARAVLIAPRIFDRIARLRRRRRSACRIRFIADFVFAK